MRTIFWKVVFSAAIILFSLSAWKPASAAAESTQIWHEWQISRITVGYDANYRSWVQQGYYLSLATNNPKFTNSTNFHKCIVGFREKLKKSLIMKLRTIPEKAQAQAVEDVLAQTITDAKVASNRCHGVKISDGDLFLSIAQRYCGASNNGKCKGNIEALAGHPAAKAHLMISLWLRKKLNIENNDLPINQVYFLSRLPKIGQGAKLVGEVGSQVINQPNEWSSISTKKLSEQFQAGVTKLRSQAKTTNKRYAAATFSALDMPKAAAIRFLDVVENPMASIYQLKGGDALTIAPKEYFTQVSDEIARTRIHECVKFRGLSPEQHLSALNECTGYVLDTTSARRCLRDGQCVPDLASKGRLDVMLLAKPLDDRSLVMSSFMPRGSFNVKNFAEQYNQCVADVGTPEKCLLSTFSGEAVLISPEATHFMKCIRTAKSNSKKCLSALIDDKNYLSKIVDGCREENSSNFGECVLEGSIKGKLPMVKNALACTRTLSDKKSVTDRFQSCIDSIPGIDGKTQSAMSCINKYDTKTKRQKWATALCIGGAYDNSQSSQDLMQVADCYYQSNGDKSKTAECWIESKIHLDIGNGDIALAAQCYIESKGGIFSTFLCTQRRNMNAELQIAAQCVEQTGGDPMSTAGCIGGQLTIKELMQCRGHHFSEGPCFGSGNEFQKLSKILLGSEISSNSVVGQHMSVLVDVTNYQVATAQMLADRGGKLLEEGKDFTVKAIQKTLETAVKIAQKWVPGILRGDRNIDLGSVINPLGGILPDIGLPKLDLNIDVKIF
ncbi:hypothetical protein ACIPEN_13445 [Herbaspirillum chlorophenolicum]|uniref:Beta-lactamase n=1 Tax=Herbaspirillum chlorophenolicum TaxID=211589 RepID=A0ABW8F0K8_9BURK